MDDAGHLPVLLDEVLEILAPASSRIVDCTVGLGGHAERLLEAAADDAMLIGIDLDESNLLTTKERLARFAARVRLFAANFADLDDVLDAVGMDEVDLILADLGVASVHLDDPERGFSFQADGPLDMRLRGEGPTAADLVNSLDEGDLADLIFRYGEERNSRRIARAIVRARTEKPIRRTSELAEIVTKASGPAARRQRIAPSTRTFMALRLATNREIENLERLLAAIPKRLAVGGRVAIISFHSLEDRLVKRAFASARESGWAKSLTTKPVTPNEDESARNPRSRSAKLRAIERIE